MAAHVELAYASLDWCEVVDRLEKKLLAVAFLEEMSARSVGVAVADEKYGVSVVPEKACAQMRLNLNLTVEDVRKAEIWQPVYEAWFASKSQHVHGAQRAARSDLGKRHHRHANTKLPKHVEDAKEKLRRDLDKGTASLSAAAAASAGAADGKVQPAEPDSLDVGEFSD